MRRIVIVSDNHIDFHMETPGVEVTFDKEFKPCDDSLYITDKAGAAKKIIAMKLPLMWMGEFFQGVEYIVEDINEIDEWYFFQAYAHMKNQPWCVFEDENWLVREMTEKDLPAMYEMYGKSGVAEFVEPLYDYENELEFTRSYIEKMYGFYGYGLWLVFDKKTGALVGRIGFSHREIDGEQRVELGYIIDADYQNRGIGFKICRKIIAIGKKYWNFREIYICCNSKNARSIALAAKLGFSYYGTCNTQVVYRLITD